VATIEYLQYKRVYPVVFFILVFIFFTYPLGLSDYWWHLSSGRWIWENGSIPSVDQFTYSYAKDENIRRVVILKAYWLSQILYYLIYMSLGKWGLILLKASLLTFPLWLLWRYMIYKGVDSVVSLIVITPLPLFLFRLDELRPVLFSFVGAISVFYVVEVIVDRLRENKSIGKYLFVLPLIMLLWANLHRGFVIGWVLLLGYLFFEVVKYIQKKNSLTSTAFRSLLILFGVSIIASLVNPNGVYAFIGNQSELAGPFMEVIDEFFSLWKYARFYDAMFIFYGCVFIAIFSTLVMIVNRRKVEPIHWVLLGGFVYEGLSTFRFSFFMVVMSLALFSASFKDYSVTIGAKYPRAVTGVSVLSLVFLLSFGLQRSAFIYGPWEGAYFPTDAARFVYRNKPPGNLFNAHEYGGYLGWVLYPEYKLFIDQRNLDYSVYEEYGQSVSGDYRPVFEKYNINTVLFYNRQPVVDRNPEIVSKLLYDPEWQLVYFDKIANVFVRASKNNNLPAINKLNAIEFLHKEDN